MLIHEFEILHFLIFFVMVFFVSAVLVVLQLAISQRGMWEKFQDELDQLLKVMSPAMDMRPGVPERCILYIYMCIARSQSIDSIHVNEMSP